MTDQTKEGASSAGYHFFDEYRTCQRKWFLHNIVGLDPPVKDALDKGKAWHAMLEALLSAPDTSTWQSIIDIGNSIFPSPLWTEANLQQWVENADSQLPVGTLQSVEGEVQFPLANGVLVTGRIDGLWKTSDGRLFILEHKTTSYRTESAVRGLEQGDQLSMYMIACSRLFGRCDGVYADVTLFDKSNNATTSMWLLTRSQDDLIQFELGLVGTWRDLRSKLLQLDGGVPAELLFPRCSNSCSTWECPFEAECRSKLSGSVSPLLWTIFNQPEQGQTLSEDSKQYVFQGV